MKCVECGGKLRKERRALVHYTASGLSNVYVDGVAVAKCVECGEREVTIPRVELLHKAIATAIVEQPSRLVGEEVRFLRKVLGLSGVDFARRIDVSPSQLSRWERGHEIMSRMAERLLRLMVVTELPVRHYPLDLFDRIEDEPSGERLVIRETEHGWSAAA